MYATEREISMLRSFRYKIYFISLFDLRYNFLVYNDINFHKLTKLLLSKTKP